MEGHKIADYWMLEANAHKHPKRWTHPNRDEVGGASLEFVLITGDGEKGKSNRFTTKQYHDMIKNIDTKDGDVAGTCDHYGADGLPEHFFYVYKQRKIGTDEEWNPQPIGWCPQVELKGILVTTTVFVPKTKPPMSFPQ